MSQEVTLVASEGVLAHSAATASAQDGGLVAQCREGDPEAFARLVALHEHMVFNPALRLTGDPEEAKDVSQDVFLQAPVLGLSTSSFRISVLLEERHVTEAVRRLHERPVECEPSPLMTRSGR